MRIRFHTDIDGTPHIYSHGVQTFEVVEALARPLETVRGRDGSFVAAGQTRAGRYLRMIYSPAHGGDGIFIITAYELAGRQLRALKHRLKRRHP
ncbi:MAG: hypothetical protein ABSD28_00100 [Tepidisphaeraceae bacterium]